MRNALLFFAAAVLTLTIASCGGGNGTPPITQIGTGLDGQLVQGTGQKVTTAVGDGLGGVQLQLVSQTDGSVKASTTTAIDGRFSFRELPSGAFLLKIRFQGTADLDGDGLLDFIESFLPITLTADQIAQLTAALNFDDTDDDNDDDALRIDVRIRISTGGAEQHFVRTHRHRHGDTEVDEDGDGDIDDSFDDDDGNGLPDDGKNGGGHFPQGPKLRGEVEAISDSSITVDGQVFTINDGTSFRIRGDRKADPDEFEVGDEVQVTSFTNSNGDKVAIEVKLKTNHGHGGGGDEDEDDEQEITGVIEALSADSITIDGQTFNFGDNTLFLLEDRTEGALADFAVGDTVELKAKLIDNEWVVLRLKLEDQPQVELEDFNIAFSDFAVHTGQTFYLKVADAETGATVGSVTPFTLTEPDFTLTLPGILEEGKEYNVDFWADVDASGTLDGTPLNGGVDHAWRLSGTAGGDGLSLSFTHNTDFTDIQPF
jgi:hypothetical protein